MLPSMPTIPTVAPAPARGGEPPQAGNPSGGDDSEAFAHLLQHAQRPSKPAHDAHGKAPKVTGEGRPPHAAEHGKDAGAEGTERTIAGDATGPQDKAVPSDEATERHTAAGPAEPIDDASAATASPTAASDALAPSRGAVDAPPPALPDANGEAEATSATEGRATAPRVGARNAAHDAHGSTSTPAGAARRDDGGATRDASAAAAPPLRVIPERAAPDGAGAATTAHAPSFDSRPAAEPTPPPTAPFAVALRDVSASAAGAAHDAGVPHASLHAAIDDPLFGGALGHQVALWVRDGVQEARLQLHPAELGPVTVQIALDGQAAHVDFTAAVAATRDSIEQSLPALAAALRESGFTLAGGGVSSQAGQGGSNADASRDRPAAPSGDRSRVDAGIDAAASAAAPRRWTRSLLDVYA